MRPYPYLRAVLALVLLPAVVGGLAACGDDDASGDPPVVRFSVSPGEDFYAQPFPCDLRRTATGIDLTGFPEGEVIVNKMVAVAAAHSDGFAVGGAVFFAFSEPVDPASLPTEGAGTLAAEASVFLVDVDPASPERGTRVPLWLRYEDAPSGFLPPFWLSLLPYPGVPLRPGTTYAAVVTDRVRTASGTPFGPDADFAALRGEGGSAEVAAARATFAPLFDWLAAEGVDPTTVVGATVFTTRRPADLLAAARAVIHRDVAAPALADLAHTAQDSLFDLYEGTYEGPIFQQGDPPYRSAGGQIEVTAGGEPELVRMETLRVAISVPRDVMPAGGWPVVIYRHGTGGDYRTFVENRTAQRLALVPTTQDATLARFAVMSIDGVMHGPRAGEEGGSPEERFYNFNNPLAGRDNSRQEAIDNFQLVRLAQSVDVTAAPETGAPLRFDPARIYFFGHSQGAITGALFVPFEPEVQAAVLSGAGAHLLLTLLRKDSEFDIPTLLELALNDGAYGSLDEFHPVLTLLQTYIEPADPLAYVRLYEREPITAAGPRSVLLTYGVGDSYTPNLTARVLAAGAGFAPAGEVVHDYEALALYGPVTPLTPPVCGNIDEGSATAVVVQYTPHAAYDGHFVTFELPTARRQTTSFLATHAADGCATLVP